MSASASVSLPNALTPWPVYSANIFTSPYECFSFPFIVSYMPHLITEPNMISTENDRLGGGRREMGRVWLFLYSCTALFPAVILRSGSLVKL